MAKKEKLYCTAKPKTEEVRMGEPFEWAVEVANNEATALHVSHSIHSLNVSPDGKAVEVSTARPLLADTVTISVQNVATTPVPPNESVELNFQLTFPLRLAKFTGVPPRVEVEEWMPEGDVEVRMTLAYGEQPFYPPADEKQLNETLRKWAKVVDLQPIKVRVEQSPKVPSTENNDRKGE